MRRVRKTQRQLKSLVIALIVVFAIATLVSLAAVIVTQGAILPFILFGLSLGGFIMFTGIKAAGWSATKYVLPNFAKKHFVLDILSNKKYDPSADLNISPEAITQALTEYFEAADASTIPPLLKAAKEDLNLRILDVLTMAILREDTTQVAALLDRGAALVPQHAQHIPDRDITPLSAYWMIPYDRVKDHPVWQRLQRMLLARKGAEAWAVPANINTGLLSPVMLAIDSGHPVATIKMLVEERKEAVNNDPFIALSRPPKNRTDACYGKSPLHAAVARARTSLEEAQQLLDLLLKQPNIYFNPLLHEDSYGEWGASWSATPMTLAISRNLPTLMLKFIQAGVSTDPLPGKDRLVPKILEHLPKTLKDEDDKDQNYYETMLPRFNNPLHNAIRYKAFDCFECLLKHRADPNVRSTEFDDEYLYTALHWLVNMGRIDWIKSLLKITAEVDRDLNLEAVSDTYSIWSEVNKQGRGEQLFQDDLDEKNPLVTAWGLADYRISSKPGRGFAPAQTYKDIADLLLKHGAKPTKPTGVPRYDRFHLPRYANHKDNQKQQQRGANIGAAPERTLYQILELSEDASTEDIKRQYKKLAFRYHPDRNRGNEEAAAAQFKEMSDAYHQLTDPPVNRNTR